MTIRPFELLGRCSLTAMLTALLATASGCAAPGEDDAEGPSAASEIETGDDGANDDGATATSADAVSSGCTAHATAPKRASEMTMTTAVTLKCSQSIGQYKVTLQSGDPFTGEWWNETTVTMNATGKTVSAAPVTIRHTCAAASAPSANRQFTTLFRVVVSDTSPSIKRYSQAATYYRSFC